ncbi:sugar nucleotide-binding protein [Microbacterium sp. NPDC055502]
MTAAPPPHRTLLVGFGKLGARLAPRLVADGGEVVALRRSDGPLPQGVTGVMGDLAAPLREPLPAVDAVVVTLPPGTGASAYPSVLAHLAAALPSRPARTVFVSSTGVFEGAGSPTPLTERDAPEPVTDRGRGLREGERAAVDLFGAVVVRPAGIYGPGRDFLVRRVREGAPVNPRRRTNRIHETDLVRTLDLLLRMPEPPSLVHAVDAAPAPLGDVVAFLAARLGLPVPPDDGGSVNGFVYDGALLRSLLGHLDYPSFEDGYADMLERGA